MDEEHSPFRNRGRREEEAAAREAREEREERERNKEAPIQVADPRTVRQLPRAATTAAAAVLSRDSSIIRG